MLVRSLSAVPTRLALPTLLGLPALLALSLAWPASAAARSFRLEAGPSSAAAPEPTKGAAWTLLEEPGDQPRFVALDHALQPSLSHGPTLRVEALLPGGGRLSATSLGIFSSDGHASLPVGSALPLTDDSVPEQLLYEGTWHGVDELFLLQPQALKHDLLVHEAALAVLGSGGLRASWSIEAPAGTRLEDKGPEGVVLSDASGVFLARIPAPLVADAADDHWHAGLARWELEGEAPAWRLDLLVDAAWLRDPARSFPLHLDPTFSLQPFDSARTGFVDEHGQVLNGAINSGSLEIIFSGGGPTGRFGRDCRGFAEFDTSAIPDGARVLSVRLQVWLSNHDNPGREIIESPVQPLEVQVKQALAQPTAVPPDVLWTEIGGLDEGPIYVEEVIPETGPQWCADSYVFRDWDLGLEAREDLEAQLPVDFFTVGFASFVGVDVGFDHVDWVGFPESGLGGFGCPSTDLPGSRITLVVETDSLPVCDAGGPYLGDCPSEPILLDGSASFDPDGDAFDVEWTTDCEGLIADPSSLITELLLDASCEQSCTATLTLVQDLGPMEDLLLVECVAEVEVQDLQPPVLTAPDDLLQECPAALSEADWLASASAVDDCSEAVVEAVELSREIGCGDTQRVDYELTAVDACGNRSAAALRTWEVVDTSPPVITASFLEDLCLWPPRHDGFALGDPSGLVEATDACSEVSVTWIGCASDQPDEAREEGRPENGDGHFHDDCRVSDDGSELVVRVERAGNDPEGRHYGLLVLVSDACGNSVVVEGSAHVPHDRRGGSGGQDDPCLRGNKKK